MRIPVVSYSLLHETHSLHSKGLNTSDETLPQRKYNWRTTFKRPCDCIASNVTAAWRPARVGLDGWGGVCVRRRCNKNLRRWDAAGFCVQARLPHRCPKGDAALAFLSLWTGKTGCTRTLSSWKFQRLIRRTPQSPGRQFSTGRNRRLVSKCRKTVLQSSGFPYCWNNDFSMTILKIHNYKNIYSL